jgi:hypothetical protein
MLAQEMETVQDRILVAGIVAVYLTRELSRATWFAW